MKVLQIKLRNFVSPSIDEWSANLARNPGAKKAKKKPRKNPKAATSMSDCLLSHSNIALCFLPQLAGLKAEKIKRGRKKLST